MITPKVSVIVPVYNVEDYLEECLDSLVNQTMVEDLEVIMVNDGSKDNSGAIMDRYANLYENFIAYHKENGGLGHARNYGAEYATGEYIIFLDSDDYVTKNAYRKMYETAQQTGSDMVIGNVMRFNSTKVYGSGLHKKVFKETTLNTHITKNNELIYDTTAWNKLFKKSFWDKHQFKFPENILYEDLPVTVPAHYLSESTDVLEEVIYYWRARDGVDKSITQQRHEIKNFTDRLTVMKMVDAFFNERVTNQDMHDLKDHKWLTLDIMLYLKQLDIVDDEYMNVFCEKVANYTKQMPDRVFQKISAIDRLKYYLIQQNEQEKLLKVLDFQKNEMRHTKVIKKGDQFYGNYPFRSELPNHLFLMGEELSPYPKIEEVKWVDDGNQLHIKGYNYIRKVDMKKRNKINLEAKLVNPQNQKRLDIPVEITKRPDVTHKHGVKIKSKTPLLRVYNYNWSGYELTIDFGSQEVTDLGKGRLELWFTLRVDNLVREFRAGGPIKGQKPRPPFNTGTGRRVFPKYNKGWDLVLESDSLTNAIQDIEVTDDELFIKGWSSHPLNELNIEMANYKEEISHYYSLKPAATGIKTPDDTESFMATIDFAELEQHVEPLDWVCYLVHDNERLPLTLLNHIEQRSYPRDHREARIGSSPAGNLIVDYKTLTPTLAQFKWSGDDMFFDVKIHESYFDSFSQIKDLQLSLQHVESGHVFPISCRNYTDDKSGFRHFNGRLKMLNDENKSIFDIGKWDLFFEAYGEREGEVLVDKNRVRIEDNLDFEQHVSSGLNFIPYRTASENFSFKIVLYWEWLERGPRRQEVIRKLLYPVFRLLPINKKTVVFESYWGRSVSCNPRAIYEYMDQNNMDYNYIWVLNNENKPVEGSGKAVRKNSWKYYFYLATAKFFINNANFPDFYEKRPGAVEIQTLHGTPLKTMGLDIPGEVDTEEKRAKFLRRCARWDFLTSPSRYVTDLSKHCFAYDKEVLEYGFPRNDALSVADNPKELERIKADLKLPKDKKVILYAPTWRVRNSFNVELDLERMQEELGDEYVVLLRLHYFVSNSVDVSPYKGFAYNVSSYDRIEELYAIADMLITDYSSVMFDYANLNRPILYFTYDLELYRDQLRGFYMNLEEEAPGPLVKTNDELIDAINNIDQYDALYGEKMEAFRAKYCQFDSGDAAKRVVDRVILGHEPENNSSDEHLTEKMS